MHEDSRTAETPGEHLFVISVYWVFYMRFYNNTLGPTALRPIRRTKQWLSVLLQDTSVTAGDIYCMRHTDVVFNFFNLLTAYKNVLVDSAAQGQTLNCP